MGLKVRLAIQGIALAFLALAAPASAQTWNLDADGNWNVNNNWNPAAVPNGVGASATLGNVITAPRTLALPFATTLGTLLIDNANAYTLSGAASTLTFQVATGNALLQVANTNGNGSHDLGAPKIALNSNLDIDVANGCMLTLSRIEGTNNGIQKKGAGPLLLGGP